MTLHKEDLIGETARIRPEDTMAVNRNFQNYRRKVIPTYKPLARKRWRAPRALPEGGFGGVGRQ